MLEKIPQIPMEETPLSICLIFAGSNSFIVMILLILKADPPREKRPLKIDETSHMIIPIPTIFPNTLTHWLSLRCNDFSKDVFEKSAVSTA